MRECCTVERSGNWKKSQGSHTDTSSTSTSFSGFSLLLPNGAAFFPLTSSSPFTSPYHSLVLDSSLPLGQSVNYSVLSTRTWCRFFHSILLFLSLPLPFLHDHSYRIAVANIRQSQEQDIHSPSYTTNWLHQRVVFCFEGNSLLKRKIYSFTNQPTNHLSTHYYP